MTWLTTHRLGAQPLEPTCGPHCTNISFNMNMKETEMFVAIRVGGQKHTMQNQEWF